MGTIIVAGILTAVVAAIAASLVRGRKHGKTACGGNCAACKACRY